MKAFVVIFRALGVLAGAAFLLFALAFFETGSPVLCVVSAALGVALIVLSARKRQRVKGAYIRRGIAPKILAFTVTVVALGMGVMTFSETGPHLINTRNIARGMMAGKTDTSTFGPGDTVNLNGVVITFHGVNETRGNSMLLEPGINNIYAIAEFTVENNTGDYINISGFFGSEAYCDGYLVQQNFSAEMSDPQGRSPLSGSVAPGRKLRGIIGYELPSQWQELEISIKTDWWQGRRSDTITFVAGVG